MLAVGVRHRVVSALAPGMAATYAVRRQPQAFQRPMLFNCFHGVKRARRGEPATSTYPGTYKIPVEPDGGDKQGLDHRNARSSKASASTRTSFLSSVRLEGSIFVWSLKTRSQAGKSPRFCRKASRMTLLMAL